MLSNAYVVILEFLPKILDSAPGTFQALVLLEIKMLRILTYQVSAWVKFICISQVSLVLPGRFYF